MATTVRKSEQLELPLPPVPDTDPIVAVIDTRLAAIATRALPSAQAHLSFLESVWTSEEHNALPVFVHGEPPILCHTAGVERLSAAAARTFALAAELAALNDLKLAIERYDMGGRLEIDGPPVPTKARAAACFDGSRSAFPDLRTRTEFLRRLREYAETVNREIDRAVANGNLHDAVRLKAELAAIRPRIGKATHGVRRRPQNSTQAKPARSTTRRIA